MNQQALLHELALIEFEFHVLRDEKRNLRTGEPVDAHAAGRVRGLVFRFRELDAELRVLKGLSALRYGVVPSKEN